MLKKIIPASDLEFDQFFRNIIEYVSIKGAGTKPDWAHVSLSGLDVVNRAYTAWYSAYAKTIGPHTQEQETAKHNMRRIAEKALRDFIDIFLYFDPVTSSDRMSMGIPEGFGDHLGRHTLPATRPQRS